MNDIVERLRACESDPMWADHAEIPKVWCKEAAAEIERLRGENERLRGHIYASNRPQPEEVERMRAALQVINRTETKS
jgi:hypothetical protein